MAKRIGQIISVAVLMVALAGCGGLGEKPTESLVAQAIALQMSQTQQTLGAELNLDTMGTEIAVSHVQIRQRSPLTIDNLPAFQVQGTYAYTLKLPQREIRRQANPFEVYLQRQSEGKTWRLARLEKAADGTVYWVTQRLPWKQER